MEFDASVVVPVAGHGFLFPEFPGDPVQTADLGSGADGPPGGIQGGGEGVERSHVQLGSEGGHSGLAGRCSGETRVCAI